MTIDPAAIRTGSPELLESIRATFEQAGVWIPEAYERYSTEQRRDALLLAMFRWKKDQDERRRIQRVAQAASGR